MRNLDRGEEFRRKAKIYLKEYSRLLKVINTAHDKAMRGGPWMVSLNVLHEAIDPKLRRKNRRQRI